MIRRAIATLSLIAAMATLGAGCSGLLGITEITAVDGSITDTSNDRGFSNDATTNDDSISNDTSNDDGGFSNDTIADRGLANDSGDHADLVVVDTANDSGGDTRSVDASNDSGSNFGLVGYWKLDDGKSPIIDSSGYGNNGTLFNGPTWTAGPTLKFANPNAMVLNGTNQYASLGNAAVLNFSGQITIAAWVKPTSNAGIQNILAHGFDANHEVYLRIADGSYEIGSYLNFSYFTRYGVPGADLGTWVHLAGVYDGTTWRLYRNGIEVSSSGQPTGAVTVTNGWAIGANSDGSGRRFAGAIDDVRIYKRALSAAEIADVHRGAL
jgi:hypothetical protein